MEQGKLTSLISGTHMLHSLKSEQTPPTPTRPAEPPLPEHTQASPQQPNQLLDPALIAPAPSMDQKTRTQINKLMSSGTNSRQAHLSSYVGYAGLLGTSSALPAHLHSFIPTMIELAGKIRGDLESNLTRLLSLNPSRREAVAQHLDQLAGIIPGPNSQHGNGDAAGGLRRWIDGSANPIQQKALQIFFEEVALVALGQAVLLKAWSDRGLRSWRNEDLGRLNWALSSALKPHVPLDREGWQITRPNLYSWYNPSLTLQKEIWTALEAWRITDEGPWLLAGLIRMTQQLQPDWPELKGYDPRFFDLLWNHMENFGFNPNSEIGPMKRKRIIFSPTLRDGAMVRTGPASVSWIGLEAYPFQLLVAELVQLWWGPAAPPVWALGSGLEVHARDQLALALGSPKPSLYSRISEMEACDLSFVMEERIIRANGRSNEAGRLRNLLEDLTYFKKLRSAGTTLGGFQSCVAMSKLRPGGLLWWAREEPLSSTDGQEMLSFLLDRARLLCEWDLSNLEHSLPGPMPISPKYLYLFVREPNVQERSAHRPRRIILQGQVRSHVEMPLILGDVIQAYFKTSPLRGHWQIHQHVSPTAQKEWSERWPDPAAHDVLHGLEELRIASVPLASITTVRPTPQGDPVQDHAWSVHPSLRGLWIHADYKEGRRLIASTLPNADKGRGKGSGYLVLVPDETWIAPLAAYLESSCIQNWLEHHSERRGERWVLSEQIVKFIPISKFFLQALGIAATEEAQSTERSFAMPLPGEWEKLASEVAYQPKNVKERLSLLAQDENGKAIHAAIFVRAARALDYVRSSQQRLFSLVSQDGRIRWRELFEILPKTELMPAATHPSVRLSGTMPPHLPISRIEKVKTPLLGFLLATETGFHLHIGSENPRLAEMIGEQLDGLIHPTWHEIAQYLKLPRHLDLAESTAHEVLRSHGEQTAKLSNLAELLNECLLF